MEVKKIVEGMTASQVAQVIDDNFKAQNKILEEDIAKQNNVIGVSEYKDFSEAEAVNVGNVRKYNGFLYECVEATTGAFDASKWKKSSFKAETEKKLADLGKNMGKLNDGYKSLYPFIKEIRFYDGLSSANSWYLYIIGFIKDASRVQLTVWNDEGETLNFYNEEGITEVPTGIKTYRSISGKGAVVEYTIDWSKYNLSTYMRDSTKSMRVDNSPFEYKSLSERGMYSKNNLSKSEQIIVNFIERIDLYCLDASKSFSLQALVYREGEANAMLVFREVNTNEYYDCLFAHGTTVRPSGIKSYELYSKDLYVKITINWDFYESFNQTTNIVIPQNTGLREFATLNGNEKIKRVLPAIKSIDFYSFSSYRWYIRVLGYSSVDRRTQVSLQRNGLDDSTSIRDLILDNNIDEKPSGIKSYEVVKWGLKLNLVINWDELTLIPTTPFQDTGKTFELYNTYTANKIPFATPESALRAAGFVDKLSTERAYLISKHVRSFKFYEDGQDEKVFDFVLMGANESLDRVQITTTSSKGFVDFKFPLDDLQGIKIYEKKVGSAYMKAVIDWTGYDGSVIGGSTAVCASFISSKSNLPPSVEFYNIGYSGSSPTVFPSNNILVSPIKKAKKSSLLTSVCMKVAVAGDATLVVGEVDQYLLFVARESYKLGSLSASDSYQTIDLTERDIYVGKGESIGLLFENGGKLYCNSSFQGSPTDEEAFYYTKDGSSNKYQLQIYGAEKLFKVSIEFNLKESDEIAAAAEIAKLKNDNRELQRIASELQASQNVISDRSGNNYKLIVANGDVTAIPMTFSHVICVGNSYTTHPTVNDVDSDYNNNFWWGHWSMAASAKSVAWTTLLQNNLRSKKTNAKVTPIFGRRYETGLRTLNEPEAFTYWDENNISRSLKENLSSFSDVDCVVFFLGDNYSEDYWYDKYKPMVDLFVEWFPSANIVCCSNFGRPTNNQAIEKVAKEVFATYINVYGLSSTTGARSKLGNYVYGDDEILHQINYGAVGSHIGDYGGWLLMDRISKGIGYENINTLYSISLSGNGTVSSTNYIKGSVVSIFTESNNVSVTNKEGDIIEILDHGNTEYGRVITFIMPNSNVSIICG